MKKITVFLFTFLLVIIAGSFFNVSKAQATTQTFSYTGAYADWTVPAGVTSLTFDGYGGGVFYGSVHSYGGRVTGTLAVTPLETLRVYVGRQGVVSVAAFGGGGATLGGSVPGGAGATDVRQGGTGLANRVIVCGGSGSNAGVTSATRGNGGTTTGQAGGAATSDSPGGGGGTPSGGGAGGIGYAGNGGYGTLGVGGAATSSEGGNVSGSGGGGLWGGGGGGGGSTAQGEGAGGGGGGSSYAGTGTSGVTHTQGYASATGNGALTFTYTAPVAPTITTPTKTSIAGDAATLGGNVTSDGGATVTGRGVCVGTSSNPAVGGTCFTTTGTTGVFTVSATGLSSATLYHYRAYATNSIGTSYTTDDSFTTATPAAPAVAVSAETNVDSISTTLNGTVNPGNGATSSWYFWGTSNVACASLPNATASQSLGSGASPVALTAALSGFTPGVTYYYCVAAVNSLGMTYSAVTSFVQGSSSGCSQVPLTGDYATPASCVFGNPTSDGVDKGTGTQNDGVLTIAKGTTLSIGANQTIVFGLTLLKPGATVVRLTGGSIRRASIWVPDTDGDGYPDNPGTQGQIIQVTYPAGYSRRAAIGGNTVDCAPSDNTKFKNYVGYTDADGDGYTTSNVQTLTCGGSTLTGATQTSLGVDCNDTNANVYTSQNVATDADQDSYSTGTASSQCAGASQSVAGSTYYKDASGAYSFIASANIAGTSDCNDSNANIYQNVSVATDADQDGYSTSTASTQCVGASSTVSGRTYYVDSAAAVTQIAAASILATSDCNDSNATVQDSKVTYVDADGDGLTGTGSTLCLSHATGASVSCSTNYSIDASSVCYLTTSGGADCNDNIHDTYAYAWGENIGWINLASCNGGVSIVNVSSSALTGYAWAENAGWISFNCSNTSSCGTTNYSVANASGTLSGYAWGENIGWISFNCSNTSSCGTVNYKVTIDSTGAWSGWAWGENVGWISFNCSNTSSCGTTSYYVKSAWHP